jgi:hypothetical protein
MWYDTLDQGDKIERISPIGGFLSLGSFSKMPEVAQFCANVSHG